jgi:hypothetical protein
VIGDDEDDFSLRRPVQVDSQPVPVGLDMSLWGEARWQGSILQDCLLCTCICAIKMGPGPLLRGEKLTVEGRNDTFNAQMPIFCCSVFFVTIIFD